jgi:hypothetical protein
VNSAKQTYQPEPASLQITKRLLMEKNMFSAVLFALSKAKKEMSIKDNYCY